MIMCGFSRRGSYIFVKAVNYMATRCRRAVRLLHTRSLGLNINDVADLYVYASVLVKLSAQSELDL
jgi:hypothetical protein